MDPGFLLVENFARLAAIVGLALAVPLFAWGGYLWMTSMGDPQRSASARNALVSVGIGVIVIGISFIVPRLITEFVVVPSGGISFEQESSINCDGILRDHLVLNRDASDARRINFLIRHIQSRFEGCGEIFWSPVVRETGSTISSCFDLGSTPASVAGVKVPDGLYRGGSVQNRSGRDSRNNILVHWTASPAPGVVGLPSDGSICWLYVSAFETWVEGYP